MAIGTSFGLISQDRNRIVRWLFTVAALIFFMVLLGGVTRLTESGLSIVDWRPVTGTLPPLTDEAWQVEFDKYRTSPEFEKKNSDFSVADFKTIFWFEYLHRLLGRLIGLAFAVPFFWMLWRGQIPAPLKPRLWLLLGLGGLQGFMGWYMVASGLVDQPYVSQYRLAAHLGLAFAIYGYIVWLLLALTRPAQGRLEPFTAGLALVIFAQILLGAFVAGLDAGFIYNTWPAMSDGYIVPPDIYSNPPLWPGMFEDHRIVQFNHRMLAYLITVLVAVWWWLHRRAGKPAHLLAAATLFQVVAGIVTLVLLPYIPAWLAVFHQAGGLILFTAALYALHMVRRP
ncbi:COX15/CtaA family protein [Iodidimonas sp. SYSU 1G8]|uniref:COX15/CtaA family protein n=1 Tax=Iodidimonas sp. SYSU 1G8 TaxID=3133967 RepID=UPI0031FE4ACF